MLKNKRFSYSWQTLSALIFSCVLVVINVIRIFRIPLTIDETGYSPADSYIKLIQDKFGSANNHILHSVLRKFFVETFGVSLFTLRVDSLIAQIIFLICSFSLFRILFKNGWWALSAFVLLNVASMLVFQFWGLSRGYALALACMTVSIYYLIRFLAHSRHWFLLPAFAAAILSVLANFGYINYFIALSGTIFIQCIIFRNPTTGPRSTVIKLLYICCASGILAMLIVGPLTSVLKNGELAFLGNHGFIEDTVRSLAKEGLLFMNPAYSHRVDIIKWAAVSFTFVWSAYWVYIYVKKRIYTGGYDNKDDIYGITLFLLLIIPAVSMISQHIILNVNYLTDRTALFFIILFTLNLTYWLYHIWPKAKKLSLVLLIGILSLAGYNFVSEISFDTTCLWWFNRDDLHVLKRIIDKSGDKPGKIKLHVFWLFVQSFNFDIEHYYKGRFEPVQDIRYPYDKDTSYDYYYEASSINTDSLAPWYDRDTSFVGGGFNLYKKKH